MKYEVVNFTFAGKRHKVRGHTREEAIKKAALLERDLKEGKRTISKNMTVEDWAIEWMQTYKRPVMTDGTYNNFFSYLRCAIFPAIGYMQLKDVKPLHCQSILNSLDGKSSSYVTKVNLAMRGIFQTAIDNHLLIENPAQKLSSPKTEDGTHRALTKGERKAFLSACEKVDAGLWGKVIYYCGLRPGETAYIQGRHIDREKKLLTIDGTKNKNAKRIVPIPDALIFPHCGAFEYLFTTKAGKPLTKTARKWMWASLERQMNIDAGCKVFRNAVLPPFAVAPDLVPYCLRHDFCTRLQEAGVPIDVARRLMGHARVEMTSRIYTHYSEDVIQMAANSINAFESKWDTRWDTVTEKH